MKLDCPRCGNPAMTAMRKLWLGPAPSVRCRACNEGVGVSWAEMLAFLPFPVALLLVFRVEPLWLKAIILAGGVALACWGHLCWVPLRRR
jgi:hypothetical protein